MSAKKTNPAKSQTQTKSLQMNIRITPETRRQLARLCLSLSMSESELIRILVADTFAKFDEACADEIEKIQKGVRKAILGLHVVK
jgi:hypothetical protein